MRKWQLRRWSSLEPDDAGTTVSIPVRNTFLLFISYSDCGVLFYLPEQNKTPTLDFKFRYNRDHHILFVLQTQLLVHNIHIKLKTQMRIHLPYLFEQVNPHITS